MSDTVSETGCGKEDKLREGGLREADGLRERWIESPRM